MRKPTIFRSFYNAINGVFWALKSERNFQIEIAGFIINVFLMLYLKISLWDAAILLMVSFAVLSLEIINTCIEKICDHIQPNYDSRIKVIKDLAAGSVLLMAIAAIVIGVVIYSKYLC